MYSRNSSYHLECWQKPSVRSKQKKNGQFFPAEFDELFLWREWKNRFQDMNEQDNWSVDLRFLYVNLPVHFGYILTKLFFPHGNKCLKIGIHITYIIYIVLYVYLHMHTGMYTYCVLIYVKMATTLNE